MATIVRTLNLRAHALNGTVGCIEDTLLQCPTTVQAVLSVLYLGMRVGNVCHR